MSKVHLTTGDLARRTGSTLRTVRFYEEAGLLAPSGRANGGRRHFTESDLQRLQLIADLRNLGLSLEDIKRTLSARAGCASPREMVERLAPLVEEQLELAQQRLVALRRLNEELNLARESLGQCKVCRVPLKENACPSCKVVTGAQSPRLLKVLLCQEQEGPLVGLRIEGRPLCGTGDKSGSLA